jgi:hypothetical protein
MRHKGVLNSDICDANWRIRIADNRHETKTPALLRNGLHKFSLLERGGERLNSITIHGGHGTTRIV